jgi:ATP-dependent helicase/DNAse subunit B
MEKKIDIQLDKKVEVIFTGIIDKIMYYQKIEDTYFSIVDYKSGYIDTHIEPMKYGLHMQLPVYLYLIHYSKVIPNPIFTGIYYQNILFNYPTYNKYLEKEIRERTYLQGYSTEDTSILERFDPTYEKSELIRSMSYTDEKGFGTYTKTMNEDTLYNLVKYTKNHIDKTTDSILDADFDINPKMYAGKNISCEFCPFNDICYTKEKDLTYLDKVEDLSFLGGEE